MNKRDSLFDDAVTEELRSRGRARRKRREALADLSAEPRRRRNDLSPDLEIERLPVGALSPSRRRARRTSPEQLARVRRSIERFGIVLPLLIDEAGSLIAGHIVLEAAIALGVESVPVVRLAHLDETDARQLRIALNRLGETGEWDLMELQTEFEELLLLGANLIDTGFATAQIDLILEDDDESLHEEKIDLPPAGTGVSWPGDIWQAGPHVVACGDARDGGLIERMLGGRQARTTFLDPPYNVPLEGHVSKRQYANFAMGVGEMTRNQFRDFLIASLRPVYDNLTPGGTAMVCMDWRSIQLLLEAGEASDFDLMNLIVWAKPQGGQGSLYRSQHELIALLGKPGAAIRHNIHLGRTGRYRTNVWNYAGVTTPGSEAHAASEDHPTPKPVALIADALRDLSARGDVVLDAFLGGGATLIAAQRTGRVCVGTELNPHYLDVSLRRYIQETGEQPILVATGELFDDVAARRAHRARPPEYPHDEGPGEQVYPVRLALPAPAPQGEHDTARGEESNDTTSGPDDGDPFDDTSGEV